MKKERKRKGNEKEKGRKMKKEGKRKKRTIQGMVKGRVEKEKETLDYVTFRILK